MKKCPFCAEEIQDAAIKCRYCGSDLSPAGTRSCPFCSKVIPTSAKVCPSCGDDVSFGASGASPRPTEQPRPFATKPVKSRGIYIILGILLGLLGIHNFYAGYYGKGAAQLIITSVLGWLAFIGIIITGIWTLVDLITVTEDADGIPMA